MMLRSKQSSLSLNRIIFLQLFLICNTGIDAGTSNESEPQPSYETVATGWVSFSIITDTRVECDLGLTNPGIYNKLEYRKIQSLNGSQAENEDWIELGIVSIPIVNSTYTVQNSSFNLTYVVQNFSFNFTYSNTNPLVQYRLIQWEHGGGDCNCWGVVQDSWMIELENHSFPMPLLTMNCDITGTQKIFDGIEDKLFCFGSASVPRGYLSHVLNLTARGPADTPCPEGLSDVIKDNGPPLQQECSNVNQKIVITFQLGFLSRNGCNKPQSIDEGVELAVGNWEKDGYWIPLRYYYSNTNPRKKIKIGDFTCCVSPSLSLRGFDVPVKRINETKNVSLEICNQEYLKYGYVQFRWLQTSTNRVNKDPPVDVWALDNVTIRLVSSESSEILLMDNFDNYSNDKTLNKKFWNQSVRNGNVSTLCHAAEDQGQYLVFGERVGGLRIENNHYFVSRLVSTASLNFQYVTSSIKENTEEATTRDVHPCILTPNQRNYKSLKDVEDFFKPKKSGTVLASGVFSTLFGQCQTKPVIIQFANSKDTISHLQQDESAKILCVFWDFQDGRNRPQDNLSAGQWSDRGCNRNENLSNTSVTVCECNRTRTYFAILLSAAPPEYSQPVTLSLQIIGYVGVSISLVAMALTIVAFLALKPLRNMRNFIHINLCINLGIAQIIFVAGVDQSASDHVPIHCKVIAVLLHYFFLVSFMWMLMEGVVLYVVLVRVFVKNKKRYLIAFTIASYGIPLLYLGVLAIPLGFALPTQPNYGYHTACFMNPETNFIWAFIAPVIVIFLANIGFFIMAATIIWRQKKKQTENTQIKNIKSWLKSALSLVVIMGLTWVFGVLIVEVEVLIPLAYIYTILVAFQGLFIFVIFVCMSKNVREAYSKWWRVKVNESDLLSKYFGEKNLPSTKKTSGQNINHTLSGDGAEKDSKEETAMNSKRGKLEPNSYMFTNPHVETSA